MDYKLQSLTPSVSCFYGDVTLIAGNASTNVKQTQTLSGLFLAPGSEVLTYDLDGNLTQDGRWDYTWDAENRLISMETNSAARTAGVPGRRLDFQYDSMGRRISKRTYTGSPGSWVPESGTERRFIYQGWNLVEELLPIDASTFSRIRTYAWGLDIAGAMGATGGIGALLQLVDHTGTATAYLPAYDGSGNVAALMKSDGTIVATYEYSPFGELLRKDEPAVGGYAKANPIRGATKYTDEETGLVYYGHRYYSPSLGRFINRDPSGEAGGMNLYGFCGNDGINRHDVLGLDAAADEKARLDLAEWWMNNKPDNVGIGTQSDVDRINRQGSIWGTQTLYLDGADGNIDPSAGNWFAGLTGAMPGNPGATSDTAWASLVQTRADAARRMLDSAMNALKKQSPDTFYIRKKEKGDPTYQAPSMSSVLRYDGNSDMTLGYDVRPITGYFGGIKVRETESFAKSLADAMTKIVSALNRGIQNAKTADEQVMYVNAVARLTTLGNKSSEIQIQYTSGGNDFKPVMKSDKNPYIGFIKWNPSLNPIVGGVATPNYITLAHELFHAYDRLTLPQDVFQQWSLRGSVNRPEIWDNMLEFRAVQFENVLRQEASLPMREDHSSESGAPSLNI